MLGPYPLLPDKMEVQRDDKGNIYYVYSRNSDENPTFKEYGNIKLKAEDGVFISPDLGFDGLIGYSPIAMAKNAVGMTLACEEYGAEVSLQTGQIRAVSWTSWCPERPVKGQGVLELRVQGRE